MSFLEYKTNLAGWFYADSLRAFLGQSFSSHCVWLNMAGTDVSGISTDIPNEVNDGTGQTFLLTGNQLNGRPALVGTGHAGVTSDAAMFPNYATAAALTVVAVVRIDSIPTDNANFNNESIFAERTAANTGIALQVRNQTPPVLEARNNDGAAEAVTIPFTLGQWGLAILQHGGGNLFVGWNDETNLNSIASGNTASLANVLGIGISSGFTANQYLNGAIAEILFFKELTSQVNLARVCNYLRAKWFSPNATIASPSMRADALEQARDVASRRLWLQRAPVPVVTADVPLWVALDADPLTDISMATPLAPSPSADGTGWKNSRPDRRRLRIYSTTIDMDKLGSAQIVAADQRNVSHIYQETGLAIRASSLQRQGIANDGAVRAFSRGHTAWIVDPSSGAVVQIDANAEKVASGGNLLEDGVRNYNLRSAFIAASSGLTSSGLSGVIATIATDANPPGGLLFDTSVTANSLAISFTATGTSGLNSRMVAFHPSFSPAVDLNVLVFSIDHYDDVIPAGSSGLGFGITRSSDGFAWDVATNAWSSTKGQGLNQIPVSTGAFARYSVAIANATTTGGPVFTAGSSYQLAYGFPQTITSTHTAHVFQADLCGMVVPTSSAGGFQGIEPYWATSRVVTNTVVVDRLADDLHYYTAGYGVFPASVGTFRFKFCPLWNAADVRFFNTALSTIISPFFGAGTNISIFQYGSPTGTTSAWGAWAGLQFNPATTALEFVVCPSATGTTIASVPWSPVAGTTYKITVRLTSPTEGELGLAANTVSVFVSAASSTTVKGTDLTSSSSALAISDPFYWSNAMSPNTGALVGSTKTPGGYITSIESLGDALTDQEIATW